VDQEQTQPQRRRFLAATLISLPIGSLAFLLALASFADGYRLLGYVFLAVSVMLVGFFVMVMGYSYEWTGFRSRTLWDWLHLLSALAIPIVLAGAGFLFTANQNARQQELENQRSKAAQELEDQRAQAEALQAYLDQMSQLLLEQDLLKSEEDDPARTLAQARTTTIITRLDAPGNRSVTRFLTDSGLTGASLARLKQSSSVSILSQAELRDANLAGAFLPSANLTKAKLENADLSNASLVSADLSGANLENANLKEANLLFADLSDANLSGANLRKVDLTEVNLEGANLQRATLPSRHFNLAEILQPGISLERANLVRADLAGRDLTDASLEDADLTDATLEEANLKAADLTSADLSEVNLAGANLAQADLTEATITPKQLDQAESLEGATMPNGQKYENWLGAPEGQDWLRKYKKDLGPRMKRAGKYEDWTKTTEGEMWLKAVGEKGENSGPS
jgi:uncharacterized protein YjbI with pentapeptide repeats